MLRSSIGPKPGKRASLDFLVERDELPGDGWRQIDERTWRTGESGSDAGWAQRARERKSITGWRSFESKPTPRWVWVQVVPLASTDDAREALAVAPSMTVANARFKGEVTTSVEFEPPPVAGAFETWANISEITLNGNTAVAVTVAAVLGSALVVVSFSAPEEGFSGDDVNEVMAAQAA